MKEIKSLAAYNLSNQLLGFAENLVIKNGKYYIEVPDYTCANNFPTANWAVNSSSKYSLYLGNSEKEAIEFIIKHFFKYNY